MSSDENQSLRVCPQCGRPALTPEAMDALEGAGLVGPSSLACMKDNVLFFHPQEPLAES